MGLSLNPVPEKGSRKFTLALLIITVASLLVLLEQLTGRQWVEVCGATMLFYGASNVGEHWTQTKINPTREE